MRIKTNRGSQFLNNFWAYGWILLWRIRWKYYWSFFSWFAIFTSISSTMVRMDWEDLLLYSSIHFNKTCGKPTIRRTLLLCFLYQFGRKLIVGRQQYLSWTDMKQHSGESLIWRWHNLNVLMLQILTAHQLQPESSTCLCERQPQLVRPASTSAPLSCFQLDLAHGWALPWFQSSRLGWVQPGCLYPHNTPSVGLFPYRCIPP